MSTNLQEALNRSVFADIQLLFPGQLTTNPVEVFIREMQGKMRTGQRREVKIPITFGDYRRKEEIALLPRKDKRSFEGTELAEAIIEIYNNEYWLLAFWNQMLLNASRSSLGREIVRAIIKHCIFVTAEDLFSYNRPIDVRFIKDHGLTKRVNYYKRVFTWHDVYLCIRVPARRRLEQRFNRHREAAAGFGLRKFDFVKVKQSLPEINRILGGSNLPEIVADAQEQIDNIGGILQTVYLSSLFWRDSARIRKALHQFAEARQ